MQEDYLGIFFPDEKEAYLHRLVKAADKLSALIKCIEEAKTGNKEFVSAQATLKQSIDEMHLEEADEFMKDFLPSYSLTLDELR